MAAKSRVLFTRYPRSSVLVYNGTTMGHYLVGALGLILGYPGWVGYLLGLPYLALSLAEMYLHMPLKVCPNCVYYRLEGPLCVSGLHVISRRIARPGNVRRFSARAQGLLCPNNLYMASLFAPVAAVIPSLFLHFSPVVLAILVALLCLVLFRFFVIFPKIACVHCRAQGVCPQAKSMGFGG